MIKVIEIIRVRLVQWAVFAFCIIKYKLCPTCINSRVEENVESALSALAAIFSAHSMYFNNFQQKIPYFD